VGVVCSGMLVFMRDDGDTNTCDTYGTMVTREWCGCGCGRGVRGSNSVSGESVRKSLGLNVSEDAKIMFMIGSRSIF
jgi:hypothetical protein